MGFRGGTHTSFSEEVIGFAGGSAVKSHKCFALFELLRSSVFSFLSLGAKYDLPDREVVTVDRT